MANDNTLRSGEVLYPGQLLQSTNGRFQLLYQADGNLVLFEGNVRKWESGTSGKPAGGARMDHDGDLCLYSPDQVLYWTTGKSGFRGKLVLENDGALNVLRDDVAWTARTDLANGGGVLTAEVQPPPEGNIIVTAGAHPPHTQGTDPNRRTVLRSGEVLTPGQKLLSPNGRYQLIYQTDGNLVFYRSSQVLWQTQTSGRPAGVASMQADGHFCLYSPGNVFYWGTGVHGFTNGKLVVEDGGGLTIRGKSARSEETVYWSAVRSQVKI